ncbi:hypothetical protein CcaverHIS641_0106200 [Cutaneotrichosporon cavernicola]|nr:hypothetical protein CcaverHIS641_0106200 [Cutaneotrichosporon cavernicola]
MSSQPSTFKRFVEVGRVVLVNDGPSAGKLAVIAEIIDHNRALIDGPSTSVPRQAFPYRKLILTPLHHCQAPPASGVAEKWAASAWAKKLAAREVRKEATDFDRFNIMLAKKQRRDAVRKAHFKERKAAA